MRKKSETEILYEKLAAIVATYNLPTQEMRLAPYNNYLSSTNLFLRPLFPQDWIDLCPIFTDPETMKYFASGKAITPDALQKLVLSDAENNIQHTLPRYAWAVITSEGVSGRILLKSDKKLFEEECPREISYCIVPKCSGRGFTTEASKIAIDYMGGTFEATVHTDIVNQLE